MGVAELLERLQSRALSVSPYQCVRARHRKAACTLCADFCPTGAIQWGDAPRVNADRCVGCGVCAAVCPTGVFEALGPTDAELVEAAGRCGRNGSPLNLACPREAAGKLGGALRVPCLGRLDASVLVAAVAAGGQGITLLDGDCGTCPKAPGRKVVDGAAAEANAILEAAGYEARVVFGANGDGRGCDGKSGEWASAGPCEQQDESASRPERPALRKGELPVKLPDKRSRLLAGLRRAGAIPGGLSTATHLWAKVTVGSTCTGCLMCAFFCPTGALSRDVHEGRAALAFREADCTACGLCQDVCYTGSIELAASADLRGVTSGTTEIVWSSTQTSSREEKVRRLRGLRSLRPSLAQEGVERVKWGRRL